MAQGGPVDVEIFPEGLHVRALPIIRPVAGIRALFHVLPEDLKPVPADPDTGDVRLRHIRKIHVEKGPGGQPPLQHHLGQARDEGGRRVVAVGPMPLDGRRDGRNPSQGCFFSGGHRARVSDVDAHVGARVQAGDHEVRFVLQDFQNAKLDAVGRCAVDGIAPRAAVQHHRVGAQRKMQRDPVPHGRALAVRSDDGDRVAGGQPVVQRPESFGMDSIVVGQQNVHHCVRVCNVDRRPLTGC